MDNKENNFVSAVVYVHNAEKTIDIFLSAVMDILKNNFLHSEIICVNDGSSDESVQRIRNVKEHTATNIAVSILNMSYFHGIEMAMNAGVDLAIGDFVFEFDSTVLNFEEKEIMRVYHKALEGFDIVSASPDRKQKLTSRVFYRIFEQFANVSGKMFTESFRVLSRRAINRVSGMNKSVPYRKALYANCGLKTENIVYVVKYENKNTTFADKEEQKYRRRLAVDALILFTEVGYRFSVTMTLLMMLMTLFMIIYTLVIYLTSNPVAGWTTTILFFSVVFLGLFGILTIIIKYLQILVDLVFKRRYYSFESVEKLT